MDGGMGLHSCIAQADFERKHVIHESNRAKTQVPKISIQHVVNPAEHSRVSVSTELRKPGQGFAWGQQWSPSAGPAQDKCKGLPLALKTVVGTLRDESEVDEWRDILSSKIWEQPSCLKGILPALMLSYNDLPPNLKGCFAFCAIYPKDYAFCKDQVIYLWIANGLVKQLEENEGSDDMLEQSRHMSYSMGREGDFEKLKPLSESEQLRTLLPINSDYSSDLRKRVLHNILPRLTSLRALSLSGYYIEELPDDLFIKLKLLRFLDLSQTCIEKLPDSVCALYKLETLLLSFCTSLEELQLQMEKLINLRHLDISNTWVLKMPLHLSKLKSLQVLVGAKFLVGGLRMEDLGELENLYGSLSVLELQNVVERCEAVKEKIREKNHVEQLSLEWSEISSADNSQTERDILDELHPHENIKEVEITGYRGTKFPNCLAHHSFLKLVELSLSNCKDCDSLPALGELPCLKFLSIRGMHGITEVTQEFYGSSSSKKPFNCLEKLEFEDMPEWKQWHVLGSEEFPILEKLSFRNCPKLPENLSSLTELRISKTPLFDEAGLFASQLQADRIVVLSIDYCNSVTSLPFRILPSSLKRITISHCQKLILEESVYCNMFLEELRLHECDCIDNMSPELFPRARNLRIALQFTTTSDQEMHKTGEWPKGVVFTDTPCLRELSIYHDGGDEDIQHWELPSSIQRLTIDNLKTLSSQHLKSLTSLQHLRITNLPQIQSLLEEDRLPSSLSALSLGYHHELHSLSLSHLTSLRRLHITACPNLQSLSESALPSSLSQLIIFDCPDLQSLPVKGMPSSLSYLSISNCPLLKPLLEFDKGEYWPNIAQIPIINIHGKHL
ncbi:hypothetical protein KY284_008491 [Solanum tuberosum]|nr:hypothetical protein KY284_008491 [Solanum tuberosum]